MVQVQVARGQSRAAIFSKYSSYRFEICQWFESISTFEFKVFDFSEARPSSWFHEHCWAPFTVVHETASVTVTVRQNSTPATATRMARVTAILGIVTMLSR